MRRILLAVVVVIFAALSYWVSSGLRHRDAHQGDNKENIGAAVGKVESRTDAPGIRARAPRFIAARGPSDEFRAAIAEFRQHKDPDDPRLGELTTKARDAIAALSTADEQYEAEQEFFRTLSVEAN